MQTATQSPVVKAIKTFVSCKNIFGASFVGVKGYTNMQGEVSNQTFLVGFDYNKMLVDDLAKLKAFDLQKLEGFDPITAKEALSELVLSLEKRLADEQTKAALLAQGDSTLNRSEAQKDAYIPLAKGLKTQDGFLYIYGLSIRKKVLIEGVYKTVNSRPKTIAKGKIEKLAELKSPKFKMFKLGGLEELNIKGLSI